MAKKDKFVFLTDQLSELKDADLLRELVYIESQQGPVVCVRDGEKTVEKILFCSNNYLNLAADSRVIAAVQQAAEKFGSGAAASRLISGSMRPHLELERQFANFFGTEAALYFPSGWTANEGVIKTIPQKNDIVLLDKFDHASIIDAAKASKAKFHTFRAENLNRLEKFLADDTYNRKFIVTESIFSMDGNRADLKGLIELKNAYDAILIVDEAHALGCFGKTGAGLAEHLGLLEEIDIIVAPLGKAVAATGGIVAGKKSVIDYLINKARSFIYTTAPSPAVCAAASTALDIIKAEPDRRKRLTENAEYLRGRLKQTGIDTGSSTTHIIPAMIGNAADALSISKKLYDKGFFVPAIRPPTVPAGSSRLRISVQADHTREQLNSLADALKEACF